MKSMKKSLKRKWTAFMMLLVLAVLCLVGVFLMSATVNYYINQFRSQTGAVFTTELLEELNANATGDQETAAAQIASTVDAYSGALGIGSDREYYIVDGTTGECLATSEVAFSGHLSLTGNMVTAMGGEVGEDIALFGKTMDVAIPVTGDLNFVVDIMDNRSDMHHMCWLMFMVIIAAMALGMAASAALSMVLIRTVTDPIAELNRGAKSIAQGDYGQVLLVHDPDEIGELTESFNEMSAALRRSRSVAKLERARMQMLAGYVAEGVLTLSVTGVITEMNPAAERLLGCKLTEGLTFSEVFPKLPFPDASRGATQITFPANGQRLRAVFIADEDRGFAVVVVPAEDAQ